MNDTCLPCPLRVSAETGFIVEKGDIFKLVEVIRTVKKIGKQAFVGACRKRALDLFSANDRFSEYLVLYESLIESNRDIISTIDN